MIKTMIARAHCSGNTPKGTSGYEQNGLAGHALARARTCPCSPVPGSFVGHLTRARARLAVLYEINFFYI